jgi:hypothetical protein
LRAKMGKLAAFCSEIGHISKMPPTMNPAVWDFILMNIDPPWALT